MVLKTKEEILKMNKKELMSYKWSDDLNIKKSCSDCSACSDCSDCSYCSDCSDCSACSDCSYCSYCFACSDCSYCSACFMCRNLRNGESHKYKICNVQFTKEEYEKKMEDDILTEEMEKMRQKDKEIIEKWWDKIKKERKGYEDKYFTIDDGDIKDLGKALKMKDNVRTYNYCNHGKDLIKINEEYEKK